jgi:hypothetical protein
MEAMRAGRMVRRVSEAVRSKVDDDIYEEGEEPMMLAHAWTAEDRPALIFMGAYSKCLFVPESDHRDATDWVVVK